MATNWKKRYEALSKAYQCLAESAQAKEKLNELLRKRIRELDNELYSMTKERDATQRLLDESEKCSQANSDAAMAWFNKVERLRSHREVLLDALCVNEPYRTGNRITGNM